MGVVQHCCLCVYDAPVGCPVSYTARPTLGMQPQSNCLSRTRRILPALAAAVATATVAADADADAAVTADAAVGEECR
eukprot:366435-Chlamydomonas_euryale.AAC.5